MSRFTSLLDVALGAGASVTLPHGLLDGDVAVEPNLVQPNSGTGIVVTATTATDVSFTNPTGEVLSARFLCALLFSTQSIPTDVPPGAFLWAGVASGVTPAPLPFADAITSYSTPVPGTTIAPPVNYFDRSVTVPANTLEVGDVLEILAAGEYTTIVVPGFDSANVAVSIGTFGFANGNSGPIPYSGCQFVSKLRVTIASIGVGGTMLLYQENDFVLQASGVLQYIPQQTGPHAFDTTVGQTIQVRGDWGLTTDPGASMMLKTLAVNVIKKAA